MFLLKVIVELSEVVGGEETEIAAVGRQAGMNVLDVHNHTFRIGRFEATLFASAQMIKTKVK